MNQMDKNTVPATNQLKQDKSTYYINGDGKGKRFLIVGNSITLHGVKEDIGWYGNYGMAASCMEKDYVHVLADKINKIAQDSAFCIKQGSVWEVNHAKDYNLDESFAVARDFNADVIIVRLVENCSPNEPDTLLFRDNYKKFVEYLKGEGNPQIILTSGFWKHPCDKDIKAVADECGYDFVPLGELGEDEAMKAIGLFEHSGVANHPGDKGMEEIARMIFEKIAF